MNATEITGRSLFFSRTPGQPRLRTSIRFAVTGVCIIMLITIVSMHRLELCRFRPIVEKYALPLRVDPALVLALINAESGGDPGAVSPKGARGLMQLMPPTAEEMASVVGTPRSSTLDLHDPDTNIQLGVVYLSRLLKRYDNDLVLALGAYNAGPGRVSAWKKQYPDLSSSELCTKTFYPETKSYVHIVLSTYKKLTRTEDEG